MGMSQPFIIKESESPGDYQANVALLHFAFLNQKGEPCGLMLIYRKDNPGLEWLIGLMKNNHLALVKDQDGCIFIKY